MFNKNFTDFYQNIEKHALRTQQHTMERNKPQKNTNIFNIPKKIL